jgi:hypothetical protein
MVELTIHKHKEIKMNYIYKALPFKGNVSELDPSRVAAQLTVLINSQNQEGWEFYQINSVNISVSPGCLAALVGAKSFDQKYDMAIFRKTNEEVQNSLLKEVDNSIKSWVPNCPQCGISLKVGATGCTSCGYLFKE